MSTLKHPYQIQTFSSGIAYDSDPELIFSREASGLFIDAHNAQPTSNDGNTGSIEKIKGEVQLYANTNNNNGYKCIASEKVNQYLIEIWAPPSNAFPGIVRVNGVIVLESLDFTITQDAPLQWDKSRAENFSEFYFTDDVQPPFIFDIKDMVDSLSSDPNKYFSNFDPELYQINLQSPLDTLVFKGLINVGGGGGLPVGHYQYQMRYSNEAGDRTNWSHPTPMIAIPQALSSESQQYPWVKTFGSAPNPSSVTSFAPVLKFRVTNSYNYDFIEIKRTPYNVGAGREFSPNGIMVARIDVSPGEISVREFIDPSGSNVNIALSSEDATRQLAFIDHCKSIRYFERRLTMMNVTLPSRDPSGLTFKTLNGKEGWPVIESLGKAGYNDPYNHTYKKSEMRGEVVGYGTVVYDGVGNQSFVKKIDQLKSYQYPNRRQNISTETSLYSFGTVKASQLNKDVVGQTHEIFDLTDAVDKGDICNFKNIVESGRVLGLTGTKSKGSVGGVNQECDETDEEIENHGAHVAITQVSVSYQPFTPVRQTDADVTGHNYIVNPKVSVSKVTLGHEDEDVADYRPLGLAPNYYAMGMMLAGVQNFPKWAKSFAVVRTDSAKRVLCQGIGFYSMTPANFKVVGNSGLGGKDLNKFWFYAPDIDNGVLSSDTINDIVDNPQNYKLQFVSPLGFFSEWYSAEDALLTERDRCIDQIIYARMIRDNIVTPAINPKEDAGMGTDGGDGFMYPAYDRFRNLTNGTNTFGSDGDKLFDIATISRKSEGRGNYLVLQTTENVYGTGSTGGTTEAHFEDEGCKNFTEPLYIINIIRTGAVIPDNEQQQYRQTTHYQKLESIIGKSNGQANQVFELVDERWEDCISALSTGGYGANTDRFLYIKLTDGSVQKWQNVTFKTTVERANMAADIMAGIGTIKGMFTHENVNGLGRDFNIIFDQPGFIPPNESLIMVRYDDTAPIRVFGGDTYISESIFAPIDRQASARDDAAETQFAWGIGLPYKDFKINPRYYTIRKAGASINAIQDKEWFALGYLRQLCVMFAVESRGAGHLAFNQNDAPNQFFPLINYVIRPNRWDADKDYRDNSIFDDYGDDYGSVERSFWKWGGFRFKQQINPDYSCQPPLRFFSKPEIGFEEILHYPNMSITSLPRSVNAQNAPGLRTLPANNNFIIDDNQGEIKRAWSAYSEGGGENLYAITNTGVCMMLTRKAILSQTTGGDLAVMAADSFVKDQLWLSREVGMFDEMWRGASEGNIAIPIDGGSEKRVDALFWPSKESVFRLMANQVVDIGRENYHSKLLPALNAIQPGFQTEMTGIIDRYKQQYYLHIKGTVNTTFVFSIRRNSWIGTNSFSFDRFTSFQNEIYGHRDLKTFRLNEGYIINGEPVEFKIKAAFSPEQPLDKDFIRIRVNSSSRPTNIDFFKEKNGIVQCSMNEATQGAFFLKDYNGWSQYIPRISASVNPSSPLLQGRLLIYEISHNLATGFKIVDAAVQFKKIMLE